MRNRWTVATKRSAAALLVAGLGMAGSASAVLISRGADMVYDDVLNITWTRNANLAGSSNLTFAQAKDWAANLVFGGFDDWRLPTLDATSPTVSWSDCGLVSAAICASSRNELGYMFYQNLGALSGDNKTGTQTAVGGEVLTGIQREYWSGSELNLGLDAWLFVFATGDQFVVRESSRLSAWAVRSGDVPAAVQEPETVGLLLGGLGLIGWRAKRR